MNYCCETSFCLFLLANHTEALNLLHTHSYHIPCEEYGPINRLSEGRISFSDRTISITSIQFGLDVNYGSEKIQAHSKQWDSACLTSNRV